MKKNIIGIIGIASVLFLVGCGEDTYNAFPNQPTSVAQMMGNQKVVGWNNYKKDSDKDGVPDYLDKCPKTPKGVKVDKNGCAIDSDKDGVPDYLDKCPNTPKGVKVNFEGCPILKVFRFNFKFDSYKIDKKYYPEIKKLVNIIKNNKKLKIEIEGFTDNVGSYMYNQELSLKRATALKEILINKFKISPKRIDIVGYGEANPIASNATAEGRKLNRRIVVIDKTKYINCIVK